MDRVQSARQEVWGHLMNHWEYAIFTAVFIMFCYMFAETLFWWLSFY